MRPEIARTLDHIYTDLEDHESVLHFENIKGVAANMFFIDHNEMEDLVEEGKSRSNIHEAKYLAALCRYLILQGYERKQITVLTMYTGQLIQLKNEMPRDFFGGVRVCAVDNFQGEENDIILLSLVRSNEEGSIGFLRASNRVCVALSRAKQGFYCIGNMSLLSDKQQLWNDIISDLRRENMVGNSLTLTCQIHPKNSIEASQPRDFNKAPQGGCMELCKTRLLSATQYGSPKFAVEVAPPNLKLLDCGHVCTKVCHPTDCEHKEYQCNERCERKCENKHACKKLCYEDCGQCRVPVQKTIPGCNHVQMLACFDDPESFKCRHPCEKPLPCGHNCTKKCSEICTKECNKRCERKCENDHACKKLCHEDCGPCQVPVSKTIPGCNHVQKVACSVDPKSFKCKHSCQKPLPCGHNCTKTCPETCTKECKKRCERKCENKHACKRLCHEDCGPCRVPMPKSIPGCNHEQKVACSVDPKSFKCKHSCQEPLPCGHNCTKKCSEICTKECNKRCERKCENDHACKKLCHEDCGPCQVPVSKTIPGCNHEQKVACSVDPKSFQCEHPCPNSLPCRHNCAKKCSEACTEECLQPCEATLKCQHKCAGTCSGCHQGRLHIACKSKCTLTLFCGHECQEPCSNSCLPCKMSCSNRCKHGKCKAKCGESCIPCLKPCAWKCRHYKCSKLCDEPCDRKRCNCFCKNLLKCGHRCIGLCGEPCPKKCRVCNKAELTEIFFGKEDDPNARFVELEDCDHVFEFKGMDKWMERKEKPKHGRGRVEIHLKRCPKCKIPIRNSVRYGNIVKKILSDLEEIKKKMIISSDLHVDENQTYFVNFLIKLMTKIKEEMNSLLAKTHETRVEVTETAKDLERKVGSLQDYVTGLGKRFSEQQVEEFNEELQRVLLLVSYRILDMQMKVQDKALDPNDIDEMKDVRDSVESGHKIDPEKRRSHMERLNCIRKQYIPDVRYTRVTKSEVKLTVVTNGLAQRDWFKCPKGHFYCIEICGDPLVKSDCPECGTRTG